MRQCLTSRGKTHKKMSFHHFLKFPSVFLDIAQDYSLGECVTSRKCLTPKKIFDPI